MASGMSAPQIDIGPADRLCILGAIPIQEEHYDFVIPKARLNRSAVRAFRAPLSDDRVCRRLAALELQP